MDLLQIGHAGVIFLQRKMFGVLRTSTFVNFSLAVNASGWMELTLGASGAPDTLHESAQLDGWAPDSEWQLGIGARCNHTLEAGPPADHSRGK